MYRQPILKDADADRRLLEEGFVVVPFLTAEEVTSLTDFFYAHHAPVREGMYATAHVPDTAFRMKMNDFIKNVFHRAIEEHFVNCQPLGGSFIAKGKGERGALVPHQDWNIVDEDAYRSFNIWVPLVDLHERNGAILIMPRSHRWLKTYRSASIHSAYHTVNEILWKEMTPLLMKRGEALIYDHRLLHASGQNHTDEIRLAAVYGIIPKGASMLYYHYKNANTVEVFASNPEFFLYNNIFEGPVGLKKIGELPYDYPQVDAEMLYRFMGKQQPTSKTTQSNWWLQVKEKLRFIF
ncbi:MAG: phytanoyl-CoA dioxygenase family protein [Chitinophagales bacterium]|nr:phytanoyl-CoA dioxygenase family protein [Chitinophagales bacterium]MDW8419186.1 phytanoyl-CoA dioxygenase family protein [Chitinophagales bacterium]